MGHVSGLKLLDPHRKFGEGAKPTRFPSQIIQTNQMWKTMHQTRLLTNDHIWWGYTHLVIPILLLGGLNRKKPRPEK